MILVLKNHTDKITSKITKITAWQGHSHYTHVMTELKSWTLKAPSLLNQISK